ncbi:MAG TPA: hypothetical protein VM840_10005, partial [Actinomycetota bacterium]|nr:hypothetical protein [Actinomycetota bacterium]
DAFTYTVADPDGLTSTATVTIKEADCGESDLVDDVVEPAVGSVDRSLAKAVHDVNCNLVE